MFIATGMVQLSLLVLLPLVLAVAWTYEVNTDRSGGDLPSIRMDPGADPSECEALCANRPACVAWSFVTCGDRLCWLKFQVGTPREHSCRVSNYIGFYQSIDSPSYVQASGLKSPAVEYGIDRSGSDISGMPIRLDCGADASDCALLCAKRADCLSWAANIM